MVLLATFNGRGGHLGDNMDIIAQSSTAPGAFNASSSSSSAPQSSSVGGHSFTHQVRPSRAKIDTNRNPFIFALGPKRTLSHGVNLAGRELDLIDLTEYASKNPRWSKQVRSVVFYFLIHCESPPPCSQEDALLLSLVETYGGRWTLIANQMSMHKRNGKQVRNRYFYVTARTFEQFVKDHLAVMAEKQVGWHCKISTNK